MKKNHKKALINGTTGQDGSYLAEFLLNKGYEVHGIERRSRSFNTKRRDYLYEDPQFKSPKFIFNYGDLKDSPDLKRVIQQVKLDEIYNVGVQSHFKVCFESPEHTAISNNLIR